MRLGHQSILLVFVDSKIQGALNGLSFRLGFEYLLRSPDLCCI